MLKIFNWFWKLPYRRIFTIKECYKAYKKKETFLYGDEYVTIKSIAIEEKDPYINAFIHLYNGDRMILTEYK